MNKRRAEGSRSLTFKVLPSSLEQTDTTASQSEPPMAGARIRMSELGAVRCPRFAERKGVLVGCGRHNSSVRILFDGHKYPVSLHRDYIEQIPLTEH